MKKVFDQTVRDLKREVNKKVLKVPGIEQKVLDATNNEPWGPHGSHLADIAQATRNYHEYQIVMTVIWKRINDTGKNWRHVYKSLIILEYLIAHGSERIADEIREHAYQISTLSNFQYIDSGGRDQGSNIRRKSQSLVGLVNDRERIQEARQKAVANKEKNRSTCSTGSAYKPSSGGYGDPYDDQSEDRCGYRDDDYNSHEKGKDYGYRDDDRYGRDGDKYSRNGDRYGKDYEERCGRDSYRDDDYRGHGNDDYRPGSRRSVDTDRSFDDDDRHSSRSGGGRADGHSHGERLEHQASEQFMGDPPSYDEATRDVQNHIQSEGVGVAVASSVHESSPPQVHKAASPSKSISEGPEKMSAVSPEAPNREFDAFDEFDPRGSVSAAPLATHSPELDLFGSLSASDSTNSLALLMAPAGTTWTDDFATPSTTSNLPYENPFGDSPFTATPQEDIPIPVGNNEPFPPMVASKAGFDFGDPMGALNFEPIASSAQPSFESSGFLAVTNGFDILADILPHTGTAADLGGYSQPCAAPVTIVQTNVPPQPAIFPMQPAHVNLLQEPTTQPRKEKFEPKSAVWSDTLSRGLVDLNISGAKTNPLADIGVDFDAINRKEKRKEVKSSAAPVTSAITMGKAMGSGSGIGRAPPHNPMMGMGMHQSPIGMGMGMGMGMNMGMGMGQGMQPSTMHPPGAGMPGGGYNPMMGMNPQHPQPPYGGGYR